MCYHLLGTRGKSKIKLVPKPPVCVVQNEPGDTSKEVHFHKPLLKPRYTLTTGPWSGTVGFFFLVLSQITMNGATLDSYVIPIDGSASQLS